MKEKERMSVCWGRYRVWVMHVLVVAALCFLDGPFLVHWNALLEHVSRVKPETVAVARASEGSHLVIHKVQGEEVVETRRIMPEDGSRVYVQVVCKRKLGFWHGLLRKLLSREFWETFEKFGVIYVGILACIVIGILDPGKASRIWLFVLSVVSAVTVVWFLQHMVGKLRPLHTSGLPEFVMFPEGWKKATSYSMPSGHTTFAFVLATFIGCLYPRLRPVVFVVACLTGLQRIVSMNHWLSDVYVGALIGNTATRLWMRRIPSEECGMRNAECEERSGG